MYIITGATGNVGKAVAIELLAKGKSVWAIGRSLDKLESVAVKGAEPFEGDLMDGNFVAKVFKGAKAALCVIPISNPRSADLRKDQQTIAQNYVNAIKESGSIKHVVLLSSIGAHLRNGAGVVDGLSDAEEYFSRLKDVNVLILRPTYFMENVLNQVGTIKQSGIMGTSVRGDLKFPMVATRDIAAVAAKRLLDLNFKGQKMEYILGPRDVSYNEVTRVFGEAIGKPDLKYVQFSYEDSKKAMVQSGIFSENVSNLLIGLMEGMNNGMVFNEHTRTPENTTPTQLEDFARTFATVYNESSVLA